MQEVVSETGTSLWYGEYSAYGQLIQSAGTAAPQFGYAGMMRHGLTGNYLTRYRVYNPEKGRWLSTDPIGFAGGRNLYGYVGGNPINYYDQDGLWYINFAFYYPYGGEFSFGQDPTTLQYFATVRIGAGIGGGIKISSGGRAGSSLYVGSQSSPGVNINLFTEGGGNFGPINASAQISVGRDYPYKRESLLYGIPPKIDYDVSFDSSWGIKLSCSIGGEFTIYTPDRSNK